MKGKAVILTITTVLFLTACQKDIPEPEVKAGKDLSVIPMSYIETKNELLVNGVQQNHTFMVEHHVKGSNVYIECMIAGITLRQSSKGNKGKILLYVDGVKVREVSTVAFIVKGLKSGTHLIKLEVVKPNNESYELSQEFQVKIP